MLSNQKIFLSQSSTAMNDVEQKSQEFQDRVSTCCEMKSPKILRKKLDFPARYEFNIQ